MWRIVKFLFTGSFHECKFELFWMKPIRRKPRSFIEIDVPITGYCFISQCSCGKVKTQKVYTNN